MASYSNPKDTSAAPKAAPLKTDQPTARAPKTPAKDAPVYTDWAAI